LRRFQLHLAQQQISPGSINAAIAALRFFFNVTLERPDLVRHLTTAHKPRKAPVVLSQEEVARLLEAAPGLKYKAARPGGGGASPRSRARPQVQGRAQRRLRRGPARVRGRGAEGVRYPRIKSGDQSANDAAGRTRQGTERAVCDALAATSRTLARMVAPGATAGLALSRPEPDQSCDRPSDQPRRARRREPGGNLQARVAPYLAAQLRHAPARTERRYSRDSGAARARQARDDGALHPRRRQRDPRRHEPAGAARPQSGGTIAAFLTAAARRGLAWRSPTSFAPMGRRGAKPTPAM